MKTPGLLLFACCLCAPGSGAQTPPVAKEPSPDVLKAICASEFGKGDLARVDVFRARNGATAVLALRPDITRFTHAPHTYYGPDGVSLLVVPERPLTSEQIKNDPVLQKRDALLRNLEQGGSRFCSSHR